MGGTSSKSAITQESNNLVVNKNAVNALNQQLNTVQVNTIMKEAQSCSANIDQNQLVQSKGLKSAGKLTINISQLQHSNLSFSCLNTTAVRNDIANQMAANIMQNLTTNTSADLLNQLGSVASTQAQSGGLTLPGIGPSSQSDISQIVKSSNVTENIKNITAIVNNAITNNFTSDNVKKCVSMVAQAQAVVFENTQGEEVDFIVNQQQAADLITQCVNNNNVSQNITSGLMQFFGISATDTTTTKMETKAEATAESSSRQLGIIEELGNSMANLIKAPFQAIGDAFSGLGTIGKVISFILVCICCILVFGGVGYFIYKKVIGGESEGGEGTVEGTDVGAAEGAEGTGEFKQEGGLFGLMFSPTSASI